MNYLQLWAQSVLAFPNLAFIALDTTSLKPDADIIRILAMSPDGNVLYHSNVKPLRQTTSPNTVYTGLTQEMLDDASSLAEVWPDVVQALKGKFVLAYGLDFVQNRLHENADHYGLTPIQLVGDCLQHSAYEYFHVHSFMKLTDVCDRIGRPMKNPAMAYDRIQGQIAFLNVMATPVPVAIETDLEDHPF